MPSERQATAPDPAERQRMERIAGTLQTKAAKIRALDAAGYSRSRIANFLGIRYQHVRNVLVAKAAHPVEDMDPISEHAAEAANVLEEPFYGRVTVDQHGRIALSPALLSALDVGSNRAIPWRFENGELALMNREAGIRFAQALCADLVRKHPGSWSDELIAERRADAAREDRKSRRD